MKMIWAFILLAFLSDDLNRIAAVNRLKKEAEQAYENKNYAEAAQKYKLLIDSLDQNDERMKLNLSNAYYKLKDTTQALNMYEQLTDAENNNIRSIAQQQLGVMAHNKGKYDESLEYFKNAMRDDPGNEEARYNYELLKKFMQQQQRQQQQKNQKDQQQKNKEDKNQQQQKNQQNQQQQQQQKDQQQQEKNQQQNQEKQEQKNQQQKSEEEQKQAQRKESEDQKDKDMQSQPEDMKDMKISREMAKMILEAMRNNEIQYLQQMKKKPKNPPESGKPDW